LNTANHLAHKVLALEEAAMQVARWRVLGKTVAFTNGCFDLLHAGHIASLLAAAREADYLVVALNADDSVRRLKGPGRPVQDQQHRATVMAALSMVDLVVLFEEDTPIEVIKNLLPDVLVKGGDYKAEGVVGYREVTGAGGRVVINPIVPGLSTTNIIKKRES
jgi:D-glycero-beta-D-manno-heptose 1-phosphate adenylyltransferase